MKKDITCFQDCLEMTTVFYEKLAVDPLLADIFITRLGNGDWSKHLDTIARFWETVLLGATSYAGQSFLPHATMGLYQEHFDQWLFLFHSSIDELFEGPIATAAKQKSQTMAILFMSKIKYNRENGGVHLM